MNMAGNFKQLGFCWALGTHSGWGTYALHLAVQCAQKGVAPAIFWSDSRISRTQKRVTRSNCSTIRLRRFPTMSVVRLFSSFGPKNRLDGSNTELACCVRS